MSIQERYASSTQSSNLLDDAHHHKTDILAAIAISPVELASLLYRVKYVNDATSYRSLLEAWVARLRRVALRAKWPSHVSPEKIAQLSLDYYLNPLCAACKGRGYNTRINEHGGIENSCHPCNSSGKKDIVADSRVRQYVVDAVSSLEDAERVAAFEAHKIL